MTTTLCRNDSRPDPLSVLKANSKTVPGLQTSAGMQSRGRGRRRRRGPTTTSPGAGASCDGDRQSGPIASHRQLRRSRFLRPFARNQRHRLPETRGLAHFIHPLPKLTLESPAKDCDVINPGPHQTQPCTVASKPPIKLLIGCEPPRPRPRAAQAWDVATAQRPGASF